MPRELPKTLTAAEVEALMARPNVDCPTGLRNRAMLALMHRCGFRVSDLVGVHLRDVQLDVGEIRLRAEITKGAREAVLYMDASTQQWVERWKAVRRRYAAGCPWLFTTLKGQPVGPKYVWEMVARYGDKAGIEHCHPHRLRHTFATDLLRDGFNPEEVRVLMRHTDIRTTQIYLHVHNRDLADKLRRRPG